MEQVKTPDPSPILWGTDLITFANPGYWGLAEDLPHEQWLEAFRNSARTYFEQMFDIAQEVGLAGIELAPAPADWKTALSAFGTYGALLDALQKRGLRLSSSYSPGMLVADAIADPAKEPEVLAFMTEHARFVSDMGADIIVMGNIPRSRFGYESPDDTAAPGDFSAPVDPWVHDVYAAQMNRIGAAVGKYGVRIAIHTDAYSICCRDADIARVLELTDPATIQLCPDAGHITVDGGDAAEILRHHIQRIPTMHWKDCVGPVGGHTLRGTRKERHAQVVKNFRILGSGRVNWRAWMAVLEQARWHGWANAELDSSAAPEDELRQGLEFFRRELEPIYPGTATDLPVSELRVGESSQGAR